MVAELQGNLSNFEGLLTEVGAAVRPACVLCSTTLWLHATNAATETKGPREWKTHCGWAWAEAGDSLPAVPGTEPPEGSAV